MHDVFISYSSKNKNVADAIVSDFEQNGIRCWYAPRDIRPGEEWVTAITKALEVSKALVLIYTDESNNSRQVMNEIAVAFNAGITIVPFKLSNEQMSSELVYYLTRVHWLDAVSKPLSENITALREYIDVIIKTPNGAAPASVKRAGEIVAEEDEAVKKHNNKVMKTVLCVVGVFAILVIIGIIAVIKLDRRAQEQAYADAIVSYYASTDIEDLGLEGSFEFLSERYPDSYYFLGKMYERRGDFETAYHYFETGEQKSDNLCLLGLGGMYLEGYGVEKDMVTAKSYFDNALFAGCVEANFFEGYMWTWGLIPGEDADLSKGKEYADAALESDNKEILALTYLLLGDICRLGYADADMTREDALKYYEIAVLYCPYYESESYDRKGSYYIEDKDYSLAIDWYLKAAQLGNRHSMKMLGDLYYDGIGTDMDTDKAKGYYLAAGGFKELSSAPWFERADDGFDNDVVFNKLGLIYYYDYDYEKALYFFLLAADEFDNVYGMGNAGMTYEILEDWENSMKYYGAAIDAGHQDSENFRRRIRMMVDDGLVSAADAAKWI